MLRHVKPGRPHRDPDPVLTNVVQYHLIQPNTIMSVVLPGEVVQTQHKTLKLGPGLQQSVDSEERTSIVVTRAGTLEQNAKGNKFWVEGNSRRVSLSVTHQSLSSRYIYLVSEQSMCRRHKNRSSGS